MRFDPSLYLRFGPALVGGLWHTVFTAALANPVAIMLGLGIALLQALPFPPLRWVCRGYIQFMRGTPLLVQLFLVYYCGPVIGLRLDALTAGVIGLGANGGAYFAEIFRAGFESIPRGQVEAARLLGLSPARVVTRIKLPQMLVLIIPPSVNQVIIILKETAVLSILTVPELTKVTIRIVGETSAIIEPYLALALLFWLLVSGVSYLGGLVERRMTRHL